ncbi:hypothetical protein JCM9957A_50230 [Kineosporia succinea]
MRSRPDDLIYQADTVWLGPQGMTWPWVARYKAYGVWLLTFLGILLVEAITPLKVGIPPVWELCISILATYAVMSLVTHERPLSSLWRVLLAEVKTPRAQRVRRSRPVDRSLKIVRKAP